RLNQPSRSANVCHPGRSEAESRDPFFRRDKLTNGSRTALRASGMTGVGGALTSRKILCRSLAPKQDVDPVTSPVTLKDIEAAAKAIEGHVERTPLRYSRTLSDITGAQVWIKFENLQFTASFKERGALNKLLSLTNSEKAAGIIAMSAGNHAQGVAYHAQRL